MITLFKRQNVLAEGKYIALPAKMEFFKSLDAAKEYMNDEFYNDSSGLAVIQEETTLVNGNTVLSIKDKAGHILIQLKTQEGEE